MAENELFDVSRPIVIGKRKRRKRRYSRGMRDLQVVGRRSTKVTERVARALLKGMRTFRKESDKSARKRRDGALRDVNRNVAKGLGRMLRSSRDLPLDIAKALDTRGLRRSRRRQLRSAARLSRLFGGR